MTNKILRVTYKGSVIASGTKILAALNNKLSYFTGWQVYRVDHNTTQKYIDIYLREYGSISIAAVITIIVGVCIALGIISFTIHDITTPSAVKIIDSIADAKSEGVTTGEFDSAFGAAADADKAKTITSTVLILAVALIAASALKK